MNKINPKVLDGPRLNVLNFEHPTIPIWNWKCSGGQIFDPHMYAQTVITGCAVAHNGDVSFLWEKWKFDPCKIETLEQIGTQFVGID